VARWLIGWRTIPRLQRLALVGLLALVALVNIDQPYPALAPLHHIPTLALIASAPWWLRRWPLSDGALFCLVGFFALHSIAARWTYSYVPYDAWAKAVSGTTINELFGCNRNHFDRLVHLAFGALLLPLVAEWMRLILPALRQRLIAAAILLLAASAAYELFEWLLTLFMAPGAAEAYNGQQGDMWDAHKDMALALAGSVAAALWIARRGD
jgi:putative membrane protein